MGHVRKIFFANSNLVTSSKLDSAAIAGMNNNICNPYITHAVAKMMGVGETEISHLQDLASPRIAASAIEDAQTADCIVLILQDQLRADNADDWYAGASHNLSRLTASGVPLICLSLAANSLSGYDDVLHTRLSRVKRRFFDRLATSALRIGVRGEYTASVLDKLGIRNHDVIGCPSYFEAGEQRTVRAPTEAELSSLSVALTGALRIKGPLDARYYLQGDFEWPLIQRLLDPRSPRSNRMGRTTELQADDVFRAPLKAARRAKCHFFADYERWKRHLAQHCCLAVGTRLHGAILASNAGRPAIVTNVDARARESCAYLGLNWWPLPRGYEPEVGARELFNKCDVDRQNRIYRSRFAAFAQWMASVGLPLAEGGAVPQVNAALHVGGTSGGHRILPRLQDWVALSGVRPRAREWQAATS